MNEQNLTLELSKGSVAGQIVRMGQGDPGGTTIVATVYDNGTAPSLTGATAAFFMRVPDRVHYVRDVRCTVSGNVITYEVDEEHCCSVAGYTDEAYFEITKDGRTYSTSRFRVKIERAADDGAELAEDWDNAIEAAIDAADEATETANAAAANAAATAAGIDSRISAAAHQAADEAASEVEQRVDAAIDAMGDISELAVPEMSKDVRGGAKLEEHGGLALRDGALGIGSLVQQSDGYARGGLAEVTAKGHAEQVSTTGKNLLQHVDSSKTVNGITFTKNADNSVTASGTASADAIYVVGNRSGLEIGSVYTLSGCPSGGSSSTYRIAIANPSWTYDTGDGRTFTAANASTDEIRIVIYSGVTVSNLTFYPQLELGSTATAYEPYTGGAPSPSPDYPQEIQVVRGRNLLNPALFQNNKYQTSSTGWPISNSTGMWISGLQKVSPSTQYVFSVAPIYNIVVCYNASSTPIAQLSVSNNTITTTAETMYVCFSYSESSLPFGSNIQLTLGSTPQPYVPYGHVGMEVQGKNLLKLDFTNDVALIGNLAFKHDVSSLTLKGTASLTYTILYLSKQISVNGSYTLSFNIAGTCPRIIVTVVTVSDVVLQKLALGPGSYSVEGQFTNDTIHRFRLEGLTSNAYYDCEITVQLELGSTATDYEPYYHSTTPIPLPQRGWAGSLPDGTADSLRLDGAGKCEWVNKVDCDDLGNLTYQALPTRTDVFYTTTNNNKRRDIGIWNIVPVLLCDCYQISASVGLANIETNTITIQQNYRTIALSGNYTDTTEVAQSLAGQKVYYPLATPVTEDCGYVDMPEISGECQVSIPELDALGIKYFVDDTVTQYGREIYARVRSEYADRITALEQAVAELATS